MPQLRLEFRGRAFKVLKNLPREIQEEINTDLDILCLGRFNELNIRKIQGTEQGYRMRVDRWRILFNLFSKERKIDVVDIFLKKSDSDYQKRKSLLK